MSETKKRLYAVRDDLSFEFGDPFVADSDVVCLRMVSTQVEKELRDYESGNIHFNPKPLHNTKSLYFIAEFDENFMIYQMDNPKQICKLFDSTNYYQKLLNEI